MIIGVIFVFLMFGRELKIKLLELRRVEILLDEDIWDWDWSYKLVYKVYVDVIWKVVLNFVFFGELFLLNNMFGKLEVNF